MDFEGKINKRRLYIKLLPWLLLEQSFQKQKLARLSSVSSYGRLTRETAQVHTTIPYKQVQYIFFNL